MRMIDADALFKCETCHHRHYGKCTTYCDSGESYRPDMHKLEIIEAEPVVRCKDCEYCPDIGTKTKGMVWCRRFRCEVKPNGFCSYGRKEERHEID